MIYSIAVIIFSILIHEAGHLLASLFFKVKVTAYSFGFGPVLLHKEWKGIDWRFSLIPFGGYCAIDEDVTHENSLSTIAYWKMAIILMAGIFLNLMLAVTCYLIQFQSVRAGVVLDFLVLKYAFACDYVNLASILYYSKCNYYLVQISYINLFLFLTNILPLPALDSGYLWLMPLRKKIGEKVFKRIINWSFGIIMVLQVLLIVYWWVL